MNSSGVCGTLTPVYESAVIARKIGVRKVYIRDEGNNPSGSMKDYLVSRAVALGLQKGFKRFAVVSSGNHAVSLAMETQRCGASAIVFTPGSSGKLPLLTSFTNTLVIGIRGAIFEDVYNLVSGLSIEGVYDANVCNEDLLPALMPVARDLLTLNPPPTHVLAGVGNGTYLAGIALGLEKIGSKSTPKIVAVGMKGAFPTEEAFRRKRMLHKYKEFLTEESEISAAEGSIATESYSMPQLLHALRISKGFTLGELTNQDLGDAYRLLLEDQELFSRGVIPEATGIMSLAAALRWQNMFSPEDVLHLSFTGHGAKDTEAIRRLLPAAMCGLVEEAASRARPDLVECATRSGRRGAILVDRDVSIEAISEIIAKRGRDD
ncbi:MAG: pyridoxal-phosphate dependent enzyme [Parcubacteria group bacterium]|nr:pyridoxal-phosphate dependent enzyme [Parcubacteria group bacterium]